MTVTNSELHFPALSSNDGVCVQRCAEFLEARDIGRCARVCRVWNVACNDKDMWIGISKREGIPLVEGKDRKRKEDFQVLYPRIISRKRISPLGEMVGEIPLISERVFNFLKASDPFGTGELMEDNFVFVVVPHLIRRTVGEGTPLDLDKEGNLIELPADKLEHGKELMIPLSLKNLRVLCSHPLEGIENMPVFSKHCSNAVFEQCGASSNKISVYFMRRCVVEETRNMSYDAQENFVKKQEFEVTSILIRALFDAVVILESGTCPDTQDPRYTYARCSDTVRFGNNVYHAGIGGFAPRSGARVVPDIVYVRDLIGVAPGVAAEVLRPLALDDLGLGEGH